MVLIWIPPIPDDDAQLLAKPSAWLLVVQPFAPAQDISELFACRIRRHPRSRQGTRSGFGNPARPDGCQRKAEMSPFLQSRDVPFGQPSGSAVPALGRRECSDRSPGAGTARPQPGGAPASDWKPRRQGWSGAGFQPRRDRCAAFARPTRERTVLPPSTSGGSPPSPSGLAGSSRPSRSAVAALADRHRRAARPVAPAMSRDLAGAPPEADRQALGPLARMLLAEDQVQLTGVVQHRPVRVRRVARRHREAPVEVRHELRQVGVARRHAVDPAQPHLLDQPIPERPVGPLHAPLRLWAARMDPRDVQRQQGPRELRRPVLAALAVDPEDAVAVRVAGHRPAVRIQVRPRRAHVRLGRLLRVEPRRQQPRRRVVHVGDQRAAGRPALEPVVRQAVDPDQVPNALPPRPTRMPAGLAARPGLPKPVLDHPPAQRPPRKPVAVVLRQLLAGERRPEVRVALPNQLHHRTPHRRVDRVVRAPAAAARRQARSATLPATRHKALHLPNAKAQAPLRNLRHNRNPIRLRHRQNPFRKRQNTTPRTRQKGDASALLKGDITALR